MTTGEMLGLTKRLLDIRNSVYVELKNQRLLNMMSDLEEMYIIPDPQNTFAMQIYRTVSKERGILNNEYL